MINKIYHFSDIHCRLYTRHQEYREVFAKMFSEIKKSGVDNSIICITGDIAHMKTDISPEMSDLVAELFHGCAELCPTYVFPGNHDFNEANRDKMDAITPIVNAMKHPRLSYVRESGIIVHDDIAISHLSIWDGPDKWKLAGDVPNVKRKIATYHGTVEGCITEMGFAGFSKQLPLSTFDGFDIVLLGDVHKLLFFGDKQNIAYPSSLVQQDHGEHSDDHGFLEWNLETCKATFVPIKNDYALVTIHANNSTTIDEIRALSGITSKSNVRVIFDNVSDSIEKELTDTLMSTFSIPTIKIDRIKPKITGIGNVDSEQFESIFFGWDVNSQMELFREFYSTSGDTVSDKIMDDIKKIHSDSLSKTNDNEHITRGVTWTPESFEFSNMFSYGDGNRIDFSSMSDLVGLFAPNRSGKSNLLDSILFTIHDTCTRTSLASNVMNKDSTTFTGKFTFKIGEDRYTITRVGTRGNKGAVSVTVSFIKHGIDKDIDLTGTKRDNTNSIIRKYIGTYDDFVMTTMNTQSDPRSIIDMTQKDRKMLVYKFIDLDRYEKVLEIVDKQSKSNKAKLDMLGRTNYVSEIEECTKLMDKNILDLQVIDNEILEITKLMDSVGSEIDNIIIHEIPQYPDRIVVESQKKTLLSDLSDIDKKMSEKVLSLGDREVKIKEVEAKVDSVYIDMVIGDISKREESIQTHVNITNKLKLVDIEISHLQSKVDALANHKYDPNCVYCVQNQFVIDARNAEVLLADNNKHRSELVSELGAINVDIILEEKKVLESIRDTYNSDASLLSELKRAAVQNRSDLLQFENLKESKLKLITEYDIKLQDIDNAAIKIQENKINSEIKKEKLIIRDNHYSSLKLKNSLRANTASQIEMLKNKIESFRATQAEYEKLSGEYASYSLYLKAVGRDGIPLMVLNKVLPIITHEINELLSSVATFSVKLELEGDSIRGYIIYEDGSSWAFEMASGMEKFLITTAIRSSLVRLSDLPKPDFLLIDEGFGVLDREHIHSVVKMLDVLKSKFKFVLIVTHISELKDYMKSVMSVSKVNGRSVLYEDGTVLSVQ